MKLDKLFGRLAIASAGLLMGSGLAADEVAVSGQARGVVEIVARVQARFDEMQDLRANVAQDVALVSLGKSVVSSGTVVFKRPGKMRWNLVGDDTQVIVGNGKTIWFYQPEDEQVLTAPLQSIFRSSTPVSFLTGVGKIEDDFDVKLGAASDDGIELLLMPKVANGDLGRLNLIVDPTTFDIVEARVEDPVGNITRLQFSEIRRNTGAEDSEFEFEVPPGVDVVEAPMGY